MHFAVYVTKSGKLAVRNMHTAYEDVAVSECAEYRDAYGWTAYRLFCEDAFATACVASWGEFPS